MSPKDHNVLQLSLFDTNNPRQANYTALFDLAPRFMTRPERKKGSTFLDGVRREFFFMGEKYAVSITPARLDAGTENERDELPGEREQLVEDVIRKIASDAMSVSDQEEVLTQFSIYGVCAELARHNHTFSNKEVKEALRILHRSVIEITRVPAPGERRGKPVVSAAVFPTMALRDDTDHKAQTYVTLNPFLACAIKQLSYERVDYEWMMQVKGHLARWLFKRISLMLAAEDTVPEFMEISASDIAENYGSQWARRRDMLAHITKVVDYLVEMNMISEYNCTDVMAGRTKVDVVYMIRFSSKFIRERETARKVSTFVSSQAANRTGTKHPDGWHRITRMEHSQIKLEFDRVGIEADTPN